MWEYTDKVKKHFLNPQNVGVVKEADGTGEVGSLACGDKLKLTLKIGEGGLIEDAKFQTFGCASAIASSSALTEMLKGKTIEEAEKITNNDIANYLGGLPKEKMHCSVMGQDALGKAITCYRGEDKKSAKGELCECFGVKKDEIEEAVRKNKLTTVEDVSDLLQAGSGCGKCRDKIQEIIQTARKDFNRYNTKNKNLTNVQKIKMIDAALEKDIKPALRQDGGDIDLIDVDGTCVLIRLTGACASCSKSKITLKHYVETKLRELVSPDLTVEEA